MKLKDMLPEGINDGIAEIDEEPVFLTPAEAEFLQEAIKIALDDRYHAADWEEIFPGYDDLFNGVYDENHPIAKLSQKLHLLSTKHNPDALQGVEREK